MKPKVGIVSTNRADLGILDSILREANRRNRIVWHLVLSGDVLSSANKNVVKRALGFGLTTKRVAISLKNKTAGDIALAFDDAFKKATKFYLKEKYDAVLITGDRFEMYAFALAAFFLKIKVFHVHAGEETFGAIDNVFRHSISLFADGHFCSAPAYVARVKEIKKDAKNVYCVGAPSLDGLRTLPLLSLEELEEFCKFKINKPTALVTYHPETYSTDIRKDIKTFIKALEKIDIRYIVTASNVDEGGDFFNSELVKFCKNKVESRVFIPSLGKVPYFSALKFVDVMIGNSSSGIIEAAAFNLPVVNIGDRQKGRYRTKNIIDSKLQVGLIQRATIRALKNGKRKIYNPYLLKGTSSARKIFDAIDRMI